MVHQRAVKTRTVVVCASLLALAGDAGAQPARDGVSPHMQSMIRLSQARAALRRGETDEGVRLLQESVDLGAPPPALRELATLLEAQGRWREAAGAWTRYGLLSGDPAARDAAFARREALRRMATSLRVRVFPQSQARAARVWIDHDPPRPSGAAGIEVVMEGGRHRVRVEAPGYAPWEMMVPTGFGQPVDVVAVLRPAPDAGAP